MNWGEGKKDKVRGEEGKVGVVGVEGKVVGEIHRLAASSIVALTSDSRPRFQRPRRGSCCQLLPSWQETNGKAKKNLQQDTKKDGYRSFRSTNTSSTIPLLRVAIDLPTPFFVFCSHRLLVNSQASRGDRLPLVAGRQVHLARESLQCTNPMHNRWAQQNFDIGPPAPLPIGWWGSLSLVSGAMRESARDKQTRVRPALRHGPGCGTEVLCRYRHIGA